MVASSQVAVPQGPGSIQADPEPSRRWSAPRWQPGGGVAALWTSGVSGSWSATTTAPLPSSTAPQPLKPAVRGDWRVSVATASGLATGPVQPSSAMAKALRSSGKPQGFAKRAGLSRPQELPVFPSDGEFQQVIDAVYRQLLNRLPLAAERLGDAESQLRNGGLSVADFVARVAASDLFERRLNRMAPLRAATAAHMALLGRAAQAEETSRFLATRVSKGLAKAIDDLVNSADYANSFGRDGVPYVAGLDTQDGIPLSTVNRTASLYGGNAALNPPSRGAI